MQRVESQPERLRPTTIELTDFGERKGQDKNGIQDDILVAAFSKCTQRMEKTGERNGAWKQIFKNWFE